MRVCTRVGNPSSTLVPMCIGVVYPSLCPGLVCTRAGKSSLCLVLVRIGVGNASLRYHPDVHKGGVPVPLTYGVHGGGGHGMSHRGALSLHLVPVCRGVGHLFLPSARLLSLGTATPRQNNALASCGDDHMLVTRGYMRALYPLLHGPPPESDGPDRGPPPPGTATP